MTCSAEPSAAVNDLDEVLEQTRWDTFLLPVYPALHCGSFWVGGTVPEARRPGAAVGETRQSDDHQQLRGNRRHAERVGALAA